MSESRQRTLVELAQEAMHVQDACNLSGVALGFGRAMVDLRHLLTGTEQLNTHPIAVLWADKIASLTRTQFADIAFVLKAYDAVDAILAEANTEFANVRRA